MEVFQCNTLPVSTASNHLPNGRDILLSDLINNGLRCFDIWLEVRVSFRSFRNLGCFLSAFFLRFSSEHGHSITAPDPTGRIKLPAFGDCPGGTVARMEVLGWYHVCVKGIFLCLFIITSLKWIHWRGRGDFEAGAPYKLLLWIQCVIGTDDGQTPHDNNWHVC